MIPEIGVSQTTGFTTYFSLDQTRTLSYYRRQGSTVKHREIDDEITSRIAAGDDRLFVAVIEGDFEFMVDHRARLKRPDLIVFVSSVDHLRRLEVNIIDQNWRRGDRQIDLNDHLPARR